MKTPACPLSRLVRLHLAGLAALLPALLLVRAAAGSDPVTPTTHPQEVVKALTQLHVPIVLNKPTAAQATSFPLTFGVPFRAGQLPDASSLIVVDEKGGQVPAQVLAAGKWSDGSTRWARVSFAPLLAGRYFLSLQSPASPAPPSPAPAIAIVTQRGEQGITVDTGAARYQFLPGQGCFQSIELKHDGQYRKLSGNSGGAFYVVDSQGRRGVLQGSALAVEQEGPLHTVVRVEGDYLIAAGQRNAAGVVYFHFFAGRPEVHISHKLIVTEETLDLWFRDIGMTLPVELGQSVRGSVNQSATQVTDALSRDLPAGEELLLVQDDYPHFGSTKSHFAITAGKAGALAELGSGKAAGNWADVSSAAGGLAAQVPGFIEQFPKAFVLTANSLTIKFWPQECGRELDYRSEKIIDSYFGSDWIPADHESRKIANTARGTAKIHDLWLYPHAGPLTPDVARQFAAGSEEIYAQAQPDWIAASGVMGPWRQRDTEHFADVEAAIDDYFDRAIFISDKVFPRNGYLDYGIYPQVAQPWELKNGKWYPTLHRLARGLEYNLRRSAWILAARSGDSRYYQFARRNTRFLGNLMFSNCDAGSKPKGWMIQGNFHSPIVWGQWDEKAIRAGQKPAPDSPTACLTYASSEDVIQFVYDYFLSGDFHSRDMAVMWREAALTEMNGDVERALQMFPAVILLRPLGGVYELDHDPRVYDLAHAMLARMVSSDPKQVLNEEVKQNYGKMGETMMVFYYYYVSTGDELAREVLLKLAKHCYQFGRVEDVLNRSDKALPEAFTYAWFASGDRAYLDYLGQWLREAGRANTLAKRGLSSSDFGPDSSKDWGQLTITNQDAVAIGLPVAMTAVVANPPAPRELPLAAKIFPTERTILLFHKDKPGPAVIDLFLNNFGDPEFTPAVYDLAGKIVPTEILDRRTHRQYEPAAGPDMGAFSIWFNTYETHDFIRLRLPEDAASGASGVYRLDVGNQVEFLVLGGDIDRFVQLCAEGTVLKRDRPYYFTVPAGLEKIELFAHRPVHLFDPQGQEAALTMAKDGRGQAATGGQSGVWSIRTGSDEIASGGDNVDTFVRFFNLPMVIASHDPARLFPVDAALFPPVDRQALPKVDPKQPYVAGRFGQAVALLQRYVETPLTPGGAAAAADPLAEPVEPAASSVPRDQGTIEFYFQTLWSASDFNFPRSTQRLQMFAMDPYQVWCILDPDNSGRTGRYNLARLDTYFQKLPGHPRVRFYPQAGQWHHLAITWKLDGKNSYMRSFLDGRRRSYYHYGDLAPRELTAKDLIASDRLARLGSGHAYGYGATGELYDELRISKVVRYEEDFPVPSAAFTFDANTVLLMHLDGDLAATVAGNQQVTGKFVEGRQLRK